MTIKAIEMFRAKWKVSGSKDDAVHNRKYNWILMSFVSTFDHTNSMTDNIIDRDELQDNLINQILDDMDIKTMMAILYDSMSEDYDKFSTDELIAEAEEYYPHLLED